MTSYCIKRTISCEILSVVLHSNRFLSVVIEVVIMKPWYTTIIDNIYQLIDYIAFKTWRNISIFSNVVCLTPLCIETNKPKVGVSEKLGIP